MWHVSSRSGEASRELLYSVYFTLLYISVVIIIIIIINSSSVTTQYIHCESKTIGQEPDYLTIYYKITLVLIVRSTYDSDQPSRQYSFFVHVTFGDGDDMSYLCTSGFMGCVMFAPQTQNR